jgi:signal transduction histidine kinase
MIFIITNGLVLIAIEVYGTIDLYYLDHDPEQQITFRIILFCALLSLLFAMIYFRRRFDQERDSLIAKNLELKNINELVKQRNQELVASTDRLTKINRDIKQESEALARRNIEINDVKKNLEKNILERTKQLIHKNEELDLLFYRSSHDFRRPLASLLGLSEFARLTEKSEAREILELVATTATEMDKMFKKFNSLYQINHFEEEFQQVGLSEIINKSRKIIEKTGGQFDFVSTGIVLDLMDSKNLLLKIILDNLIENSINYRNKEVVNKIQLEFTKVDTNLEITLLDNGVGIDKLYVDQVFEMYFKANLESKGNGLGLYVVKKAVEKLDGSIALETVAGKFTKVHITIPYFED